MAADNLASISGVVFNDRDDDGVLDAFSDTPLRNVTMTLTKEGDANFLATETTDDDGFYRFDNLTAGVYTVTQDPVDGLSQRPNVTQQVITKTIEDATGVSGQTIDAFQTPVAVTAMPGDTPVFASADASASEIIGSQRELAADLTSETGFAALAVNPNGMPVLEFDSAAGSSAERSVIWDGAADGGNAGLDFGLNADLTAGGADSLVVRVQVNDLPIDITVRLYASTATDYSETTISLPGGILEEPEAFVIPFDQFIENDDGVDLRDVRAIELFHDFSAPAVDLQIDYIGTIGPMQADFPNLELGIQIEKSTDGQDADEPTGPILTVGDTAQFAYAVSNTGNADLLITEIVDDNGTPDDGTDDFSPEPLETDGINVGDSNANGLVDLNEVWEYVASRVVTPGQHTNIVKVTAEEPEGAGVVTDDDPSNHFGRLAAIEIQKQTGGEDADEPTGPLITVGDSADFTYFVSNAGNLPLTIGSVLDDNGTPDDDTDDFSPAPIELDGFNVGDLNVNEVLDEDETWEYEAARVVTPGQHTNISQVIAFDMDQQMVMGVDPSNHFGAEPAVLMQKRTNGEDADEPTGPVIAVGDTAVFTYEVSNAGNVPLTITMVSDNNGTPDDIDDDFEPEPVELEGVNVGDTDANGVLDLDETWQYTASRVVTVGQYQNIGTVIAIDAREVSVTDSDPSHHVGGASGVDLQKLTNGEDADTPTGPLIPVGDEVRFVYEVRNLGDAPLGVETITDDNGTPDDPSDDFEPDAILVEGFNFGDANMNGLIEVDEVWLYDQLSSAAPGQYTNTAKVVVFSTSEEMFMDQDSSNHFGVMSEIQIDKKTNGEDAETAPGPLVPVGDDVLLTYELSNLGNVPLTITSVTDDNGTPVDSDDFNPAPVETDGVNIGDSNANGLLDEDETWQYAAIRIATPGQHTNAGEVIAVDPTQELVTDADTSNHWGVDSNVSIEKLTDGEDADVPTGPVVAVGDEVRFQYQVSTQSNVPLTITSVTDDNGTPMDPGDDFAPSAIESDGNNVGDINADGLLDAGETWLFEATRTVTAGQHTNVGSVIALDAMEQVVMDEDPSHHLGAVPGVALEKSTNGEDADTGTGPSLPIGDLAIFLYQVSNTGNVPVTITDITDDNGTPGDPGDDFSPSPIESNGTNTGDSNANGLLDTDETWFYEADRVVTAGQFTNVGKVVAFDPLEQMAMATDPSNHFGVVPDPEVELIKKTNGEDANDAPGVMVFVGDEVRFLYEVRNASVVPFVVSSLSDDNGSPSDSSDDFNPPPIETDGFNVGDSNRNGLVDAEETWLFEAIRIATAGQHTNTATVVVTGGEEQTDTDSDPSNHFGSNPRSELVVIGNDKGPSSIPLVTVLAADSGEVVGEFLAYEADYAGGVRVATGDLDGDGIDEIITAPGKAHTPEVRVFRRGTDDDPDAWEELIEFRTLAYASSFSGGVNIAVGDVDGDGRNDLVTTPSRGAVPTKVFRNVFGDSENPIDDEPYRQFFAFGPEFISGSVVSLADMNLDGLADIVVGNVGGRRATINVFDVAASPRIIRSYFPFGDPMRGGVSIALQKLTPDDVPDLIVGAGYRGQSAVEVIDGDVGHVLDSFVAYDSNAPVRVAVQGDRIVTAQGPNGHTNEIRSFDTIIDIGGLTVVPDPSATIHLNDLADARLSGAYYLDVLDLLVAPEGIDVGPTDETNGESEREEGGGVGSNGNTDPRDRVHGDSNSDGVFDSSDLVAVFAAGEYEDSISQNSTFATGDWNGDGDFTSGDLVFVFRYGSYTRPARIHNLTANAEITSADDLADTSLDLLAQDRLFEQEDELWALRDLLDHDDDI